MTTTKTTTSIVEEIEVEVELDLGGSTTTTRRLEIETVTPTTDAEAVATLIPDDPTVLSYLLSGIVQVELPRRQRCSRPRRPSNGSRR